MEFANIGLSDKVCNTSGQSAFAERFTPEFSTSRRHDPRLLNEKSLLQPIYVRCTRIVAKHDLTSRCDY